MDLSYAMRVLVQVVDSGSFVCANGDLLHELAVDGGCIILQLTFIVASELAQGTLQSITRKQEKRAVSSAKRNTLRIIEWGPGRLGWPGSVRGLAEASASSAWPAGGC